MTVRECSIVVFTNSGTLHCDPSECFSHYIRCQSPKYENEFKHLWHLASGWAMNTNDEYLRFFYSAKSLSSNKI